MGKHKPGKGRATKKARSGLKTVTSETSEGPATFVFHTGHVSQNVRQLVNDMRRVMEPFTASHLQVRKKNIIKDFVSAAGIFNVSHLVSFTQTETALYMKLIRLPRGPTITFQISDYSLIRDVISSLKDPHMHPDQFHFHSLLLLNNFKGEGMELKLMASMFQNMFPTVNVAKVNLNHAKRCVVINYNSEDNSIDFTHWNVQLVPAGISKPIKKLVKAKVPDLSKYMDISEYVSRDGNASESEAELDGPINEVNLPQQVSGRGNLESTKSRIRLNEIGPRITMKLHKIEEGICEGEVLYHSVFRKTPEEIEQLRKEKEFKKKLKAQRKKQQEENVKRKSVGKKKNIGEKQKSEGNDDGDDESVENDDEHVEDEVKRKAYDSDDDAEYFKEEVGTAPDSDLFKKMKKRKASSQGNKWSGKRPKWDENKAKKPGQKFKRSFSKNGFGKSKKHI